MTPQLALVYAKNVTIERPSEIRRHSSAFAVLRTAPSLSEHGILRLRLGIHPIHEALVRDEPSTRRIVPPPQTIERFLVGEDIHGREPRAKLLDAHRTAVIPVQLSKTLRALPPLSAFCITLSLMSASSWVP